MKNNKACGSGKAYQNCHGQSVYAGYEDSLIKEKK